MRRSSICLRPEVAWAMAWPCRASMRERRPVQVWSSSTDLQGALPLGLGLNQDRAALNQQRLAGFDVG